MDPDAPAEVIAHAAKRYGGLDILVNNLGGPPPGDRLPHAGFLSRSDADWQAILEFNLLSAVRACRAALPLLLERGGGAIVNVASVVGRQPAPMNLDYGAAKAAMLNLTKGLSEEFGAAGVRVNSVSPGPTLTPWWTDAGGAADIVAGWTDSDADSVVSTLAPAQMQLTTGRFVEPQEIADAVALLASPRFGEHDRRRVGRRRRDAQGAVRPPRSRSGPRASRSGPPCARRARLQQGAELRLGPLAGAEQQQHVQVHPDRGGQVLRALREDRVDDEQAAVRRHRGADDGEDARAARRPSRAGRAEQVGVGAGRDGVEEVASTHPPARRGARARRRPLRRGRPAWRERSGGEDRREQDAAAAADVDQLVKPVKSYAATTAPASCSERPAIEAWNAASSAGCASRWAKKGAPCTRSKAVPPSRTASSRPSAAR